MQPVTSSLELTKNAEGELDKQWKSKLGINPQLIMPGNYAHLMFDPDTAEHFLNLVTGKERHERLR